MNRITKLFSLNTNILNIFINEVKRLIPILNKKYNQNIDFKDISIRLYNYREYKLDLDYSAFEPLNINKYSLTICPAYCEWVYNQPNSRPHKIYKSLELFIKDCACHELFHLYDFVINYDGPNNIFDATKENWKKLNHANWWIKNYIEFRKDYTSSEPIIKTRPDGIDYAYFSNRYSISYKCDHPFVVDKSISTDISYLLSGGYLEYINDKLFETKSYDIILANTTNSIYEINRVIGYQKSMFLVISIDAMIEFFEHRDIKYLDAIIYAIKNKIAASSIDEVLKLMKENKDE